ncbi:hypothetical protein AOLI_G00241060 [Acnodon oligacanthus]
MQRCGKHSAVSPRWASASLCDALDGSTGRPSAHHRMLLGQLIESLLRPPLVLEAGGLGLLQWEWCVKERTASPEGMMMKSGGQQCHDRWTKS